MDSSTTAIGDEEKATGTGTGSFITEGEQEESNEVCNILLSLSAQEQERQRFLQNKKADKSTSKRKRFMWSSKLHQDFIAAIFDIGLFYVYTEVIHLMISRNREENNQPPLHIDAIISHLNILREFHHLENKEMVRLTANRLERCVHVENVIESHMEQMKDFKASGRPLKSIFQAPIPPLQAPLTLSAQQLLVFRRLPSSSSSRKATKKVPQSFLVPLNAQSPVESVMTSPQQSMMNRRTRPRDGADVEPL